MAPLDMNYIFSPNTQYAHARRTRKTAILVFPICQARVTQRFLEDLIQFIEELCLLDVIGDEGRWAD